MTGENSKQQEVKPNAAQRPPETFTCVQKVEDLQHHLIEQIKGCAESAKLDSQISGLNAEIRYLERELIQSKIKLAQSKADLDKANLECEQV